MWSGSSTCHRHEPLPNIPPFPDVKAARTAVQETRPRPSTGDDRHRVPALLLFLAGPFADLLRNGSSSLAIVSLGQSPRGPWVALECNNYFGWQLRTHHGSSVHRWSHQPASAATETARVTGQIGNLDRATETSLRESRAVGVSTESLRRHASRRGSQTFTSVWCAVHRLIQIGEKRSMERNQYESNLK